MFTSLLDELGKPGASFDLRHLSVEGEHGFIVWSAETAHDAYELATDTFVVRGGQIAVQSFAGKITARRSS